MSHGQVVMTDKADVHALGCLLVEMCTGEPWDTGALTLKVFPPQADTAQSPLVHIMQRCLCVAPDGRPTATKVLQVSGRLAVSETFANGWCCLHLA